MRLHLPLILLTAATAVAQETSFAPPVRLRAGEAFLGQGRLYPSPVYHDLDGDRLADLVVGDLRGHLTVARRVAGATPTFAKEDKVLGADGKIVDLQNW
jgi:hypothetical protein